MKSASAVLSVILSGFVFGLCGTAAADPPSRLEMLLAASKDDNQSVRESAIQAMAEIKDPRVVDALIAFSADPNTKIRELAVASMAAVATPKCFDALVSALADTNESTRIMAAMGLGRLRDARAIEPLMELLGPHGYVASRGSNIPDIIADFGDKAVAPVAKALQTRIAIRSSLIQILMTINTKSSLEELAKAAAADDWRLRLAVVEAVARSDARGNFEPVVSRGLQDSIASVRLAAITALDRLSERQSPPSDALQKAIVKALEDNNPSARERASQLIARLDNAHALAPLTKLLTSGSPSVRRQAAMRLANMNDEAAVAPLLKALNDSDAAVSRCAALGLARLNRSEAIPALQRAAMGESDSGDYQAMEALRQMGPKAIAALLQIARAKIPASRRAARILVDIDDPAAVAGVAEAVKSGDPLLRREIIGAIGSSRLTSATALLAEAVKDPDESVKLAAVQALSRFHTKAAVAALAGAVKDPGARIRLEAIQALGYGHSGVLAEDVADALAPAVEDSDRQVQIAAANVLTHQDSPKVVPLLCRLVARGVLNVLASRGDNSRIAIIQAIGRRDTSRGTPTLLGLLKDSADPQERQAAADALGRSGGEGAGEALIACLGKGDVNFQQMCVTSLGRLREKRAVKVLQDMADQQDDALSRAAVIALAKIDSKLAWKPFLAMLNQQGGDSAALAKALQDSGGSDVVDALIAMTGQGNSPTQPQVFQWLGQLADPRATEPLQKIVNECYDASARSYAYGSLQAISRENNSKPPRLPYLTPRRPSSRPVLRTPQS